MADGDTSFEKTGAVRLSDLIDRCLGEWEAATRPFFDLGKPGHRITGSPDVARLACAVCETPDFHRTIGTGWAPVRAIAFNKTAGSNWSLGWHQDRTIAVAHQEEASGFDVWSNKDGMVHVEPPFALLERMVTLRLHLDPVDGDNAPLLVAKGSHRLGKVAESEIDDVIKACEILSCDSEAGDGWLYATPILHASARSTSLRERRVIHLDLSQDILPSPLEWAGIG
ncbi:MAG: phytanoyl-CoA dioxygenase family protein [Pseudomonadota bacterium]